MKPEFRCLRLQVARGVSRIAVMDTNGAEKKAYLYQAVLEVSAKLCVDEAGHAIDLVGLAPTDHSWQTGRRKALAPRSFSLMLRAQAQHDALQAARERQQTELYRTTYRQRAGIDGTI